MVKGWRRNCQDIFRGGANCLNVTDVDDARNMAILLVLLRERKLEEAIGAPLQVAGATGSTNDARKIFGAMIELLKTFNLDWEAILAGAQVQRGDPSALS